MSGSLSCSALNCVNNLGGLCSAATIHVLGMRAVEKEHTHCETFAEKSLKNSLTQVANMNIPGEIRQLFNNDDIHMSPRIFCEAVECIYNKKRICSADRVHIHGPRAETTEHTQCQTFNLE